MFFHFNFRQAVLWGGLLAGLTGCGGTGQRGNSERAMPEQTRGNRPAAAAGQGEAATDDGPPGQAADRHGPQPPAPTPAAPSTLRARLYLEASGSMFPYDAASGAGELNSAVQNVLGPFENLQPGSTQLFVVNDGVYPMGISYGQLIQQPNLFALAKGKGNPRYTDFGLIFSRILQGLRPGEVAVLVSDLIYSPASATAQSAQKTLSDAQTLLQHTFSRHPGKSVLLLQMSGDFKGTYFPASGGGRPYSGKRPYYLVLMADNPTMRALLNEEAFSPLREFSSLEGFRNFHLFTSATAAAPYYSVILDDAAQRGRFSQAREEKKTRPAFVHALDNISPDKKTGGLTLVVGVDLGLFYLPENVKTDPKAYDLRSDEGFTIERIVADPGQGFTHKFVLTTRSPQKSGDRDIYLSLKRQFPPRWLQQGSTTTDGPPNATQTFGLLPLATGLEKAFNPKQANTSFTLHLSLK